MSIELGVAYLSILPSTEKLAPAIKAELDDVQKDATRSGQESGKKFGDGFKDMLSGALGLASGLAVGGGLAAGLTEALDQGQMNAKLTASLGLTEAQAERSGKVAGDLFAQNYGESMEEVNSGIHAVIQNIDGMRGASESTLTRISAKVLNTADVFDQDLGGVTRAIGQMLKTGLAKNADEALDILTVGFQQGADKAEDLLDTFNEYGTQFRKIGLDGKQATGLLTQGLQAGARDADIVADALKEFAIRAVDGSQTSADAFKAMGLDAEAMTAKIAKGGDSATQGLQTVLDSLRKMKDPVKREAAAVGIFGTQAEDLGKALFALDPSKAVRGLGKVSGAAKKANDQMGNTPAAKWSSFTRTLQQGFVKVMGSKVVPAIESAVGWLKENKRTLGIVAAVVAPLVSAFVAYVGILKIVALVTSAWTTAQLLLNGAMTASPIGLIIAAIAGLVVGLVIAYKKSETFRAIVDAAFGAVKRVAQSVATFFTTKVPAAFNAVKNAAGRAIGWVKGNWPKILAVLTGPFGLAALLIAKHWDKIKAGARAVLSFAKEKFGALVGFVRGLPGKIASAASGMWDGIKDSFRSAMNYLIGKWNDFSITVDIPDKIPGLPDEFTFSTPNIPMFAKGGVVDQATLGLFGEAGPEAVVPLDRLEGWVKTAASIGAGGNAEARTYANPSPSAQGSTRSEFVITNWRTGEGYFREIAQDEIEGGDAFAGQIGRMA